MKTCIFSLLFLFISFQAFASPAQISESYGNIPLAFTVNQGQTDSQVRFTASGSGCSMFFTPSKTVFVLSRETSTSAAKRASAKIAGTPEDLEPGRDSVPEYESFALKTEFVGANSSADIVGEERLSWNNNYFFGSDPSKWQTDVPNYKKVRLLDIYNGVDLVYYGNKNRMKYDFVVKPGQDPSKIEVKYDLGENAGNSLSVNAKGQLVVSTPLGEVIEDKPYCYQKIDEKEIEIAISYKIIDTENNVFGFELGEYDETVDLVVDPELIYSTLIGCNGTDQLSDMAVDSEGCVYITGTPGGADFPGRIYSKYGAIFIVKFNSTGTALEYSSFIGDSNNHGSTTGIAVDKEGNAYITGYNVGSGFPVTNGAFDTNLISGGKCFITKINKSGNGLVYSTYLGGKGLNYLNDIAIDNTGNAYVTGYTQSSDFPITQNAYSKNFLIVAVFITKLNHNGTDLVFSTFIGPGQAKNIFVDINGDSYISGDAYVNYPYTENAFDKNCVNKKIFITKVNSDGSNLKYSTFLGGSNFNDYAYGLTVDSDGNAYVCCVTGSADFPITSDAIDKKFNGGSSDGFITKINSDGSGILYSTYTNLNVSDITLDVKENIYCKGGISSITVFSKEWKNICNKDMNGETGACKIYIDSKYNLYISGRTTIESFVTTPGAFDETINYDRNYPWPSTGPYIEPDVFVRKYDFTDVTSVETESSVLPAEIEINSVYPNPFNPSTTIEFSLNKQENINLSIYNIAGQKVRELEYGKFSAGKHSVVWNGKDGYGKIVSSGVYLVNLKNDNYSVSRKIQLLK